MRWSRVHQLVSRTDVHEVVFVLRELWVWFSRCACHCCVNQSKEMWHHHCPTPACHRSWVSYPAITGLPVQQLSGRKRALLRFGLFASETVEVSQLWTVRGIVDRYWAWSWLQDSLFKATGVQHQVGSLCPYMCLLFIQWIYIAVRGHLYDLLRAA